MSNLNWARRACGIFLLWAAAAFSLPGQTFTSLYSFDSTHGSYPSAGLVEGTDGNFYGTTIAGGPTALARRTSALLAVAPYLKLLQMER
jgi:hypothetical protein